MSVRRPRRRAGKWVQTEAPGGWALSGCRCLFPFCGAVSTSCLEYFGGVMMFSAEMDSGGEKGIFSPVCEAAGARWLLRATEGAACRSAREVAFCCWPRTQPARVTLDINGALLLFPGLKPQLLFCQFVPSSTLETKGP